MLSQPKWIIRFGICFSLLFCVSFIFFYAREPKQERQQSQSPGSNSSSAINVPLPEARLVDVSGAQLENDFLRRGKVVLVFLSLDCHPCATESEFLQTIVNRRRDVNFYGIISYGRRPPAPETPENHFPFRLLFDEGAQLATRLGITRVPIKVYLEDGIIKRAWGGATNDEQGKIAFTEWLENLE